MPNEEINIIIQETIEQITVQDSSNIEEISIVINEGVSNHSELNLDDGSNPHGTTKSDIGLGNVPNLDTTNAVNNEHTHSNKSTLDLINEAFTTTLKTSYDSVVTGYNSLISTGVRLITSGEITKLSNTIGTNTGDETTSSIQTKRPLKTINASSLEGSGNITISSKVRITQFIASSNISLVNTWRGWNVNSSNILVSDANASYGTGTTPTKTGTWYADSNVIFLKDLQKLTKLTVHVRLSSASTIQLYALVADYGGRGAESNGIEIINETFVLNVGSNLKDNFTIATHNLNANSILQIFFRQTAGSTNPLLGFNLIWEFEQ